MKVSRNATVAVGFLVGVIAALLSPKDQPPEAVNSALLPSQLQPETSNLQGPLGFESRLNDSSRGELFAGWLAQHVNASELDDADTLILRMQSTLRRPFSLAVMREVEVLLGRLFEVEPLDAVRIVESTDLPEIVLESIFRLWAATSTERAIEALAQFDDPSKERNLALAIVDVAGIESIDRVVSNARTLDADGFAMAALVRRASDDAIVAIRSVSQLASREAQEFAIVEIGRIAASIDPESATAAAELIGDSVLRESYIDQVYSQWSLTDLPQFLEHLKSRGPRHQELTIPFKQVLARSAESDPMRVLEFGQDVGGPLGIGAEGAALMVLAGDDPDSAISYLSSVPNGSRHDELTESIAAGFARLDVDAALSWANSLRPPNREVVAAVITRIATKDLGRAVRLELDDPDTSRGAAMSAPIVPSWFGSRMISDFNNPVEITNLIVASDDNGAWEEQMLSTALSRWAATDPDGAIVWMQHNREYVPVDALELVAEQLPGTREIDALISLGDLLTPNRRPEWIGRAIRTAARVDPNGALAVAERYRTEPYYGALVANAIGAVAFTQGPAVAAQMLGTSAPQEAVLPIGRRWAELNPPEAAGWAVALADQQARTQAVGDVFATWVERDADAAYQRAQGIGDRELREYALARMCQRSLEAAYCD